MQIKLSLIIALIDLLMVLVYIALIRPKYVNAKSISDTREWLFKQSGNSPTINDETLRLLSTIRNISLSPHVVVNFP